MKNITCPYSWDCGHIFKVQELNEYDFDFVQSATKKKMTFMFIHCPHCSRMFQFDTVKREATASHASDPHEIIHPKKKRTNTQLIKILEEESIVIPSPYLTYLVSRKFSGRIPISFNFEGDDFTLDFTLYTLDELCEKVNIDHNSYLRISQLKGFADSLQDILEEIPQTAQ